MAMIVNITGSKMKEMAFVIIVIIGFSIDCIRLYVTVSIIIVVRWECFLKACWLREKLCFSRY